MADPHWTSYVGMATGIIGAFTGIIGYRKAKNIKALDLRIDLRKSISDAHSNLNQLKELIDKANKSRTTLAPARGLASSSYMKKWHESVATDKETIANLSERAPDPDVNFEKLSQRELENKLIEVNSFQNEINVLIEKYNQEILKDQEEVKQLREDQRSNRT